MPGWVWAAGSTAVAFIAAIVAVAVAFGELRREQANLQNEIDSVGAGLEWFAKEQSKRDDRQDGRINTIRDELIFIWKEARKEARSNQPMELDPKLVEMLRQELERE